MLLYSLPPHFLHSGKGIGLIAKGGVVPGDLLIISEPAGQVVCGLEGESLKPEQLVHHLQAEGALSDTDRQVELTPGIGSQGWLCFPLLLLFSSLTTRTC